VTGATFTRVAGHEPWLAQGDVFKSVMIVRAGVADGIASKHLERGPALLISHGCAIDKKHRDGTSELEYLSLLPLQAVENLPGERSAKLRNSKNELGPYNAMYLGDVPEVGESYVMLTEPYTVPATFLQPELRLFTAAEIGDPDDETRIVPTVGDTRVGRLTQDGIILFVRKWIAQWTRLKTDAEQIRELLN
jgi:hypothetical protein